MPRSRSPLILQVVADGRPGGGTTNVLALIEDLLADGWRVTLAVDAGSYAAARARALGAAVVEVSFFGLRRLATARRVLRRECARLRPDVLHLHGERAAAYALLAGLPGRQPSAMTVRGYHFARRRGPRRWLGALVEAAVSRRVDETVWVAAADRALARRWRLVGCGRRGRVIRNGIRLADLPAPVAPVPRLMVCLGRAIYQKHPELSVRILAALPDGWRLRWIGGGELEGAMRDLARGLGVADRVEITGSLPRPEALRALHEGAVMVLASRWEGLPIAPVEAMALGIPAVVADAGGNREVVTDGVDGAVVAGEDPARWAAAIECVAADSERLGAAARATVRGRFTRERVLAEHRALYWDLLGDLIDGA